MLAETTPVSMAAIAVVVFGVLVLAVFLRSLTTGSDKKHRAAFGFSHHVEREQVISHGPRHVSARSRGVAIPDDEKLAKLERLRDKGIITDEDFRRTAGDLMSYKRTER